MARVYHCKYGCGFHRSRKAVVTEHEKTCKFQLVDRVLEECKQLRESNAKMNETIEVLRKQVAGLMRRRKREDNDEAIHNFDWQKDLRFDREFFEGVMKKASHTHSAMDVFVAEFLNRTPVFYKLKRQKDKLEVKGVLGIINRQPVGTNNVFTTMSFISFYHGIMDTLLDEFYEYHSTISIENDELLPPEEREGEEAREERLEKTLNLSHYRRIPNDAKHNSLYRTCRTRIISLMHSIMSKKIKQNVLVL